MENFRFRIGLWLIFTVWLLNGCAALGSDFKQPESQLPAQRSPFDSEEFADQLKEENTEWWTQFKDPVLNNFIETAYAQNFTLKTAGLRILEARARLGLVEGNMYPQGPEYEW